MGQDRGVGRLRAVVAKEVGGETILQNLIDTGAAVAYVKNGHQYAKIHEHVWDDTQGYTLSQELGGKSKGKGKGKGIENMSLDALGDLFSEALGQANEGFEVLDIGDARALKAHQDGLTAAKSLISFGAQPAQVVTGAYPALVDQHSGERSNYGNRILQPFLFWKP
jgi:hypothetical protein